MSQYTYFFIKTNSDIYYPIGTFSRNSMEAQAINDFLPYEELRPLTKAICDSAIDWLEYQIHNTETYKELIQSQIEWLKTAEGSFEERMDMLYKLYGDLAEADEETPAQKQAIGFFKTLKEIIREAEDDENYCDERSGFGIKGDSYVYAGIEKSNPNVTYDEDKWEVIENKATGYRREENE